MCPTKNTTVIAARVPNRVIAEIMKRLEKRKMTLNAWINWAVRQGVRSHERKE